MKPDDIKSKTFVYLRRSQDREDRQALSLQKQDKQVQDIIEHHSLIPIYLPAEERSAKYIGRPIFNDMMDRIEAGEARYIAVWALSRLSRNPIDGGRVIYALDTGKLLAIHTPTRTYRNTPDDKMVLAIELAFAKKNNDDLSVQVKEGFETKRARGQYPGPAPIGYINTIIRPGERNIAPDQITGPKVVQLFEAAATGQYTLDDLWKLAKNIRLVSRAGKSLSKNTLNDLLHRRTYTGVFKYGAEDWQQGTYKPHISTELYTQVQVAMGWVRSVKRASTAKRNYPYKGVLVCEECGFNITAYSKDKVLSSGLIESYVFYVCTHKSKVKHCKQPQLARHAIEAEIKARAAEFEITPEESSKCLEYINQFYVERLRQRNQYLSIWKQDHKEATDKIVALDEALETRTISPERYKARVAEHEATQVRTKELIDKSSQDAERWLELATEVFTGVVNIGTSFEHANDDERRQLMLMLGLNWTLGNKKVALTPREPLNALRHNNDNTIWRSITLEVWNYFVETYYTAPIKIGNQSTERLTA